ncbi:hypothetical protein D3C87_912510 [compost metagenome]
MIARAARLRRLGGVWLMALAMLLLSAGLVGAAPETGDAVAPIETKVGFELLSIRNVNMLSGEYEAIFNLSFKAPVPFKPEGFMLENGRIQSAVPIVNTPTRKVYQVHGRLNFEVQTARIPFDSQKLDIVIQASDPSLRYVMDPETTPTALKLSIVDWTAKNTLSVAPMPPVGDEPSDVFRYRYGVDVYHAMQWSILRFMLPALTLMGSAFLVLILPDDFKSRLGSALAAFIGTVFLQLSVGGRVPVRDVVTYWDKYQILSYLTIAVLIGYLFYDNALKEKELTDRRTRLTKAVRIVLPAVWLIAMVTITLTTFS